MLTISQCKDHEIYREIPEATIAAINCYFSHHRPPGGFVHSVLANDLMGAVRHASESNMKALHPICSYLHWEVPGRSLEVWGSYEAVNKWLAARPDVNE